MTGLPKQPDVSPQALTVLVLCGGAGRRLGGLDKPLQRWRGEPMIDCVLAQMPSQCATLISANRNLPSYAARGSVFTDAEVCEALHGTPLIGILGGLERSATDWVLVSPGDTPALETGWWQALCDKPGPAGSVIHDGERQQHLHLLLHTSNAPGLRSYLARGHVQVWRWLAELDIRTILYPHPEQFRNVNRPEDLNT